MKRQAYDLRWSGIRETLRAEQESAKREAEAKAKAQKEECTRQGRLRDLALAKSRLDTDIFELSRVIRRLNADLQRIHGEDEEDLREEKQRNGWWTYLIHGKVRETEEEIQKRDTTRLHRRASKTIKESELGEKTGRLQRLQEALRNTECKITLERQQVEADKRKAEAETRARKARMEQEARTRAAQEMRERMAREQKEYADRAARAAEEAREAQAAQEAQERAQMAAAAERRRKEAEKRARAMQAAEEVIRKARKTNGSKAATGNSCRHDRFWPKIEGRQSCGRCHAVQSRFVFECPGCKMVACASCRQDLRGGSQRGGFAEPRYGFAGGGGEDFYEYD